MKSEDGMKKRLILMTAIVALTGATATVIWGHTTARKPPTAKTSARSEYLIAGAGRVEPSSENIKLGSEINVKLRRIYVEEGDTVRRGQVLE
jgi:HlyD family secretion protein